ncbi:hypothetical protein [Microcoleus sp. PH2017_05_CCC_O_A]|uniref:hypothetical protein n=1 Tax=Microcoleus sp. PH2017_05_CCC_O_A TaxID=2798816 RepID=UPI001D8DA09A|nr:hypothetical protein [Microcoleus sp. PH2017_05_CCC_O_A]MCC3438518.1 hypothetical protein [Microcoleus sp. PH2017_05_CCC_O_A]
MTTIFRHSPQIMKNPVSWALMHIALFTSIRAIKARDSSTSRPFDSLEKHPGRSHLGLRNRVSVPIFP